MNQDWASYFCRVDDKPASMFLNLALGGKAPLESLPYMGFISIRFKDPDENGFSRREEFEPLMNMEDALIAALEREGKSLFAGRVTTDGMRDFIFYLADPIGWEDKAAVALDNFPDYEWQAGAQQEKEWDTYFDLLYPDDYGLNAIMNDRVRLQLEEHGDDATIPREIDHWLYFPSEADRDAFVAEAESEGFVAHPAKAGEEGEEAEGNAGNGTAERFAIRLVRSDAPKDIDDITWNLRELAGARGGIYDGWGTSVMREGEAQ